MSHPQIQWLHNTSHVSDMGLGELGQSLSTNEAARCYKILPTTLKDRLSGRVVHGTKRWAQSLV